MLKSIIGATLGSKLAERVPEVGGTAGAAIGAAAPWVIARMSIPSMIAIAAGGYIAKRYFDEDADGETAMGRKSKKAEDSSIVNPPPAQAV